MSLGFYFPIVLILFANLIYHNTAKLLPADANAFLSLVITYGIAASTGLILYLLGGAQNLAKDFHTLNWSSYLMGIAIFGVEMGYILMYRYGWKVSQGALVANIVTAIALLFVGLLFYHEAISLKQALGMICCLIGLFLIN